MKRDAYGDDGPALKRFRNPDDEVTFLIPSKVAGSIIGKGGTNISKLRTQGGSKADELDVRLLIHQSRAGCVIGKAGAKIKELREKTGARLKIFSNPAPQSTERVVQLVGAPDAVINGIREVLDLTRQVPIKGPVEAYDPHNYDDFFAEEYGGFGGFGGGGQQRRGGPGGGGGGGGGGRGPPRRPLGPPRGPPPPPRGPPAGPPGRFNEFGGGPPRGKMGPPPGPYGGDYGGGFGRPPPHFDAPNQPETTTQVTIPKDLAGAIIGKAGSKIRKIRMDSGAGIEIAEPLPGADDRIITITGTPHCIKMAQYLLQQSVHESNPNLGRGNY